MSFLKKLGSSFSSPLENRIDDATSEMLLAPDWQINLEVADMINSTEKGPREAMKSLRKKIRDKNPKVAVLALMLVETCMKNCGTRFHGQIADEEFMEELVKVATGRRPGEAEEKALQLIEAWGEAFAERREDPVLSRFYLTLVDLRRRGVSFPPRDSEAAAAPRRAAGQRADLDLTAGEAAAIRVAGGGAPLPPSDYMDELDDWRSTSPTRRRRAAARSGRSGGYNQEPQGRGGFSEAAYAEYEGRTASAAPRRSAGAAPRPAARAGGGPIEINRQKLEGDLEVVRSNCELLSEIIAASDPRREPITENAIATELQETCTAMSMRVMELLEEVSGHPQMDELLLAQLLAVNDDLQRTLAAYENARVEGAAARGPAAGPQQRSGRAGEPLIDLHVGDDIHGRFGAMGLQEGPAGRPEEEEGEELSLRRARQPSRSPPSAPAAPHALAPIPPPPPPPPPAHAASPPEVAPGVRPAFQEGWDFLAPAANHPASHDARPFENNPFASPPPPPATTPVNVDDFDFLNAAANSSAPLPGTTAADMDEFDRLIGQAPPR